MSGLIRALFPPGRSPGNSRGVTMQGLWGEWFKGLTGGKLRVECVAGGACEEGREVKQRLAELRSHLLDV